MQLPKEILASGAALLGAIIGYAYREYKNRMRPFLQITKIDGSITRSPELVTVPPEVRLSLETSFYVKKPQDVSSLKDIRQHWEKADGLKQLWPTTRISVDAILNAKTNEQMCDALQETFEGTLFDRSLRILLVTNRISIPPVPAGKPEVIRIFEDNEKDFVWLDLPGKAVTFGKGMNNAAVRARCEPLLALIRCLALDELHKVFTQYRGVLETEYSAAMQTVEKLNNILDTHSRWVLYCYIANMNNYPVIIERHISLTVVDREKVKYPEPCYLALVKTTDKEEEYIADTNTPLVVPAGTDATFAVITRDTQGKMPLGSAIRECYNRGQARCNIAVTLRKVGLVKRQKFRSQLSEFISSDNKDSSKV